MTEQKKVNGVQARVATEGSAAVAQRSRFGSATEGWEAYNDWLDRVRANQGRLSRQAVVAKSLYTVASYRNWADKAKGAFDKGK